MKITDPKDRKTMSLFLAKVASFTGIVAIITSIVNAFHGLAFLAVAAFMTGAACLIAAFLNYENYLRE